MYAIDHSLHRPRRISPLTLRRTVAIVAAVGLVLLAAACGGSSNVANVGSSSGARSSNATSPASTSHASAQHGRLESEYVIFARCMRSHGVSDFPDPVIGSGGHPGFRLQGDVSGDLNSNNRDFQRGVEACQHILGHQFRYAFTPSGVGKGA
jgi:hypothetical protein